MQARYALAALASLGYVALSQWLMISAPASPWNAVALLGPMLGVVGVWAWRARHRVLSGCATAAIVALCARAVLGSDMSTEGLYVAQHVLIHAGLALWFGATLRPRRQPLVEMLAERVHRQLTAPMRVYTRKVTLAWTLYFVVMSLLSLALFFGAPFATWATFANLLTPLAVALMFGGEYLLRYWLHPDFERASMADAIRAYMHPRPPPAPSRTDPAAPSP